MADEDRALSIPTPGGSIVPDWWAKAYGPTCMVKTTLDTKKPEQRALLLRCMNEDCDTAKDHLNLPMRIIGYTISPAAREVDGEVQEWVRCVLHLEDGTNVAAGSKGLLRAIMFIEQFERRAPWYPPLEKVLKARDLGNGRQWYYLIDSAPRAQALDTKSAAKQERYGGK